MYVVCITQDAYGALLAFLTWLVEAHCPIAALESTGVYRSQMSLNSYSRKKGLEILVAIMLAPPWLQDCEQGVEDACAILNRRGHMAFVEIE